MQTGPVGIAAALDLLLPRRCLLCGGRSAANLCAPCDADLPAIGEACSRCAIPLVLPWDGHAQAGRAARICGDCIREPPAFDAAVAALNYVFPTTVLVQRFKFNRSFACGAVLAERLTRAVDASGQANDADLVVPVPLHRGRLFLRVFNQAEVLARDVGRALAVPVGPQALRRTRHTAPQYGLSAAERRRNLRGAIAVRRLRGRHVALVDDVMTTGTTLGECARALKHAGAESVAVWVAARAV